MKKKRPPKPVWEPGYNGHVYWLGKTKLGKVHRHAGKSARHKYTWDAAGKAGSCEDLVQAKKAVELAVAIAGKQLDLFG
jgi:hypothetical protein